MKEEVEQFRRRKTEEKSDRKQSEHSERPAGGK